MDLFLLVLACGVVTFPWRGLGLVASGRLDPDSAAFQWVACVAYAMLAGLIARVLLMPTGPLAETAVFERALGTAAALFVYFVLTRRNLFAGVLAGAGALWALQALG